MAYFKENTIKQNLFPIGYVMITVTNTNPSAEFGGTWISIGSGKTLVGVDTEDSDFNTVEKTGGSKTKTLAVENIPSHYHSINEQYVHSQANGSTDGNYFTYSTGGSGGGWGVAAGTNNQGRSYMRVPAHNTNNTGSGTAFDVKNPYLTVYFWKKTA